MYWPSAPMLKSPVLNANATLIPVKIIGVLFSITLKIYFGREKIPLSSVSSASIGLYPENANTIPATKTPHKIAKNVEVIGFFKILIVFCISTATSRHQ